MVDVLPVLQYHESQVMLCTLAIILLMEYFIFQAPHIARPNLTLLLESTAIYQLFLKNVGPGTPANIQVSFDSGALKASISWAPTEGAFNYTVMALSDSSRLSCSTAFSSCSINPLQCGTKYLISVSASNDAGSSRSTSAVTLKTGM